jgi:selenide,water dikinase
VLVELLGAARGGPIPDALLVGRETSDDAAVYRLNATQALVATTDFFMPIVDDPFDFGRIAGTNAISDVYAMGGTPILALALVALPVATLTRDVIAGVLRGGEAACAAAGIPIAGGHTIDALEPIYGLVVLGLVHPDQLKRNASAQAGDVLLLSKPLGVGVLAAALKRDALDAAGYARLLATTTQLNTPGRALAGWPDVHALTDVTGFGLLGHLLEMCRGSDLAATLDLASVPLLPGARALAEAGFLTGASARNWAAYGAEVHLAEDVTPTDRALLTDPQTSGGLLVACAPERAAAVLALFAREGFADAAVIGTLAARAATAPPGPRVRVA